MKHSSVSSQPGTAEPAGALTVTANAEGVTTPIAITKSTKKEPIAIVFIALIICGVNKNLSWITPDGSVDCIPSK